MRFFLYEDFASEPVRVAQQIYRFVGVDGAFVPDVSVRANPGGIPKSEWCQTSCDAPNPASKMIGSLVRTETRHRVRDALSGIDKRRDRMPAAVRARLREELRNAVLALQKLSRWDLSSWLA